MGGTKDTRQGPGERREERQPPQPPSQDPVHPEPVTASRSKRAEEKGRRLEEERRREGS
ncbi:hypothetical protein ACFY7H_14750 [Streptomyces sp. NPDC012794]|uniref:hypothetical protein n=1 Tax=Streptomyces sp. NPDC012794 TaxID=3364850 RepID=UPI0036C362C0